MKFRRIRIAAVLLVVPMLAAAQGQGGGTGQGQGGGGGRQRADTAACGRELVVVRVDGHRERHASVEDFLGAFPSVEIDQGEKPRQAVQLEALLKAYGADWVEVLDCSNRSARLPQGMPVALPEYLVLTGRGNLKSVREVRPGRFSNTTQQIRKLSFHGSGAATQGP